MKQTVVVDTLLLIAILCLAAYLRFHHLETNPGWYSDEGTHLAIARELLHGRWQYLAINQSTLLFAKLPLFELLLATAVYLFGLSLMTLRALTAGLGILSVGLTYLVGRVLMPQARWFPLAAALALAIYPQAILYSRFGFSYNLLTPLLLLTILGLCQYRQTQQRFWLGLAAVAVGLGIVTDLAMVSLVFVCALIIWQVNWRDGLWAGPLLLLPLGLYVGASLLTTPDAFWFDLTYTLTRLSGRSVTDQLLLLGRNYTLLIAQDSWIAVSMIGLWLLPKNGRDLTLLSWFVPILMLGRTVPLTELSFYYMSWLLPLVALGVAAMGVRGLDYLIQEMGRLWGQVMGLLVIGVLVIMSTWLTSGRVQGQFGTVIDPFLIDAADARAVTDYVNQHSLPDDYVLTSPALAWRLNTRTADFQMAIAATGQATPHLPNNIPPARFVFDPRHTNARYVIIDPLWNRWAVIHVPQVTQIMDDVQTWPLVFSAGEITVYENPHPGRVGKSS